MASSTNLSSPWDEYIVHLPRPEEFGPEEAPRRAEMLRNIRYLLLVGSLGRPRKMAELASDKFGMKHVGTYFNLTEDPSVGEREFNIEVVDLGVTPTAHVAIISHGIGASGAEIVLTEMIGLINRQRELDGLGKPSADGGLVVHQHLCGVGRSGTRGTLKNLTYGTVGISTLSLSDDFDASSPDPTLLQMCVESSKKIGHPYVLGTGISTRFFWSGQGRMLPTQRNFSKKRREKIAQKHQDTLWGWVDRGITFIEMEDHAVHSLCNDLGIPSVSLGAVIAHRYDASTERFVLDYDVESKKRTELHPGEVLLDSFQAHWKWVQEKGGPESFLKTWEEGTS